MLKWLREMILDERGEDNPAGDQGGAGGEGASSENAEGNDAAAAGEGQGGDATGTQPKFGEFGDDPGDAAVKMFEAIGQIRSDFDNFRTKSGLTEKNLASLRQAMQRGGLRMNEETGELEVVKQPGQERKARFSEDHLAKLAAFFGNKNDSAKMFLEILKPAMEDWADELFEGREKTTIEKRQRMQQYLAEKQEVEELMLDHFPQLDQKNENFDKAFFDLATKILHEQYGGNWLKQLSAAIRAAKDLKITPQMIAKAKAEGVEAGKAGKRILGPVGGKGAPAGGGTSMRELSKDEYLALPPEKRVEYDKWAIEQRKKK